MGDFRWSIVGGSQIRSTLASSNLIQLTVPITDDDVRPGGYVYVAKWGNDITGNGSRLKPYATIQAAKDLVGNQKIIVGSGTYNQTIIGEPPHIIGDGDVVFDGSSVPYIPGPIPTQPGYFIEDISGTSLY
jgi:hypothetical protein